MTSEINNAPSQREKDAILLKYQTQQHALKDQIDAIRHMQKFHTCVTKTHPVNHHSTNHSHKNEDKNQLFYLRSQLSDSEYKNLNVIQKTKVIDDRPLKLDPSLRITV